MAERHRPTGSVRLKYRVSYPNATANAAPDDKRTSVGLDPIIVNSRYQAKLYSVMINAFPADLSLVPPG